MPESETAPNAAGQPGSSASGHWSRRDLLAVFCATAGEALVVSLVVTTGVSPGTILAVHCAVASWTWLILFAGRTTAEDQTIAAVILLLVVVAGPAGALAAALLLPFAGQTSAGPHVLHSWYRRLAEAGGVDPAIAMHDRVMAGRVMRLDAPPPSNFHDIIANGTLEERQMALGLMARCFHPDFAPALEAALRSPEPVVRVQAAAVVARVRGDLKVRIAALLGSDVTPAAAMSNHRFARAADLQQLSACSLVDAGDRVRCRTAASRLFEDGLASARDVAGAVSIARPDTAAAIERFLIDSGRLKDFRIARRVRALSGRGVYRVRRIRGAKAVA